MVVFNTGNDPAISFPWAILFNKFLIITVVNEVSFCQHVQENAGTTGCSISGHRFPALSRYIFYKVHRFVKSKPLILKVSWSGVDIVVFKKAVSTAPSFWLSLPNAFRRYGNLLGIWMCFPCCIWQVIHKHIFDNRKKFSARWTCWRLFAGDEGCSPVVRT